MITHKHLIFDHDGTLVSSDGKMLIFKGLRDLLKLLSQSNKLYIWTMRGRASCLESLRNNDILDFFTDIYCGNDGEPKPSAAGAQAMLDGVDKDQVMLFGDSSSDAYAAKNFGVSFYGCVWGGYYSEDSAKKLHSLGAKKVFYKVEELEDFLKEYNHV